MSEEEILLTIEGGLGFKLYTWQKGYILDRPCNVPNGRQTGHTTAFIVRTLLSEGPPIKIYDTKVLNQVIDGFYGPNYSEWFRYQMVEIYNKLSKTKIKPILREIQFKKER